MEERQPKLIVVCGKKGVGKSYTTIDIIREYVRGNPQQGIPGRKALIFDVNNEYSDKNKFPDVRAIALEQVPLYALQNFPQIRRVAPFFSNGTRMGLRDMADVLQWILLNYYNGLLLVEDINKYVSDNMPADVIGAICTNRHAGVEIIIQYQSIGRVSPKVWQNLNVVRLHKNTDSVDRHEKKFEDKYECLKIAEKIIINRFRSGDKRFWLYVDFDDEKIRFDESRIKSSVTDQEIMSAISEYVAENPGRLNIHSKIEMVDKKGNKMYTREKAVTFEEDRIYNQYFLD